MKKKIFLKFFLLSFLSALLVFSVGLISVNLSAKSLIKQRLKAETKLACALVSSESDFEKFGIYFQNDEFRVSVFSLDGTPLYESDTKEFEGLENHADRKEIQLAVQGKSEAIERFSKTFNCKMTYYAQLKTLAGGEQVVIRLAVKNSQVSDYVSIALPLLGAILLISAVLSIVFANHQARALTQKIVGVGESLKSLNEGTYLPIYNEEDGEELNGVYNEINEISASLLSYIVKEGSERKKLETVLSNVAQGIVAVSYSNKIAFANKSALKLFNGEKDVQGKELSQLICDDELMQKITGAEGEYQKLEHSMGGRFLTVGVRKILDNALIDSLSYIIIITDVTQEREMARQKSEFFANASHELKTPVTVMQGLSEILISKDLEDSTKKQVERIYKESQRLSSLISDMLKLSKLERGSTLEQENVRINLKEVVEELLNELSGAVQQKNIKSSVLGEGEINADGKKIYELIGNLLSNAVNYNVDGGEITVTLGRNEQGVVIEVRDTGIGIEKEHLPRLCERFYRVDKSRSKKTGGTGLGLAIVKHVCALYDAKLSIDSEIGVGTTVKVNFKD